MNFVPFRPEELVYQTSPESQPQPLSALEPVRYCRPHFGWVGGIELKKTP